jgi:isopentenyldiphosphate isomerase
MVAAAGDERVEVVDADGTVVGVVSRREMRAQRLRHRTVFVVVQSTDGRVLVHQRSPDKDIWPNWWDMAVGGVVGLGEEWDTAARREVEEEIGVIADPVPIDDGELATYEDDMVSLVGRRYRVVHDGPFTFADGEVVQARFVTREELARLVDDVPFLPDSLQILLPLI